MNGLSYVGIELELKFIQMAQKNLALWNAKFSSMPKWVGSAQVIGGDSRHLCSILSAAGFKNVPVEVKVIERKEAGQMRLI